MLTNEELQGLLDYWQNELRLRDWDITARFVRVHEVRDTGQRGGIRWEATFRKASVRLIIPDDYDPSAIVPYDAEQTLVRELLHLHTYRFSPDEIDEDEETALNVLASALVRLKRNAK